MSYTLEPDRSFDDSFKICTEGLKEKTVYSVDNNIFRNNGRIFEKDAVRFFASLQGLINRDHGKTHTSLFNIEVNDADTFWLDYMMQKGKCFNGYAVEKITSLQQLFETFKKQIEFCGLIYWDSLVPATANVAATVCGLDGFLPVQFSEEKESFCQYIKKYNFEVKQDLCGMFGKNGSAYNENFKTVNSAKCDAYYWAMKKYMSRCSSRYLAYVLDGAPCAYGHFLEESKDAGSAWQACLYNHDYYIARRCFFFDLTCIDTERPCDDPNQPLGTDLTCLKAILQERYNRAKGEFGQLLGFPPWWIKYTTHNNMGTVVATTVEWIYVSLVTSYNTAKEADAAHPCYMSNASLYNKYESNFETYKNSKPQKPTVYDYKTRYFTFYAGDYDSSAWMKVHVKNFWENDQTRGDVPINWAFNPNLEERVPMVFDYIHEKMTPNDYFTAGEGAGYALPSALFTDCLTRTLPSGGEKWAEYCKKFYTRHDLDCTGFIINGNYPMTPAIMKTFNKFSPAGSFHNDHGRGSELIICQGVPYIHLNNGVTGKPDKIEGCIKNMFEYATGKMGKYNFSAYRNVCDSPSQLKALAQGFIEYAEKHDPGHKYEYVDYKTFFDLIRQSGQGKHI